MSPRLRDKRGRFVKRPTLPPLDPELVKRLGEGRPAVRLWQAQDWRLVIHSKRRTS